MNCNLVLGISCWSCRSRDSGGAWVYGRDPYPSLYWLGLWPGSHHGRRWGWRCPAQIQRKGHFPWGSVVETHHGQQLASSLVYLKQKESELQRDWTAQIKNSVKVLYYIYRWGWLTLRALAKASGGSSEALSLRHVSITFWTVGLFSLSRGVWVFSSIRTTPSHVSLSGQRKLQRHCKQTLWQTCRAAVSWEVSVM